MAAGAGAVVVVVRGLWGERVGGWVGWVECAGAAAISSGVFTFPTQRIVACASGRQGRHAAPAPGAAAVVWGVLHLVFKTAMGGGNMPCLWGVG